MQQMWSNVAVLGMLAMCSTQDIKTKRIHVNPILAFGILGVLFHILWRIPSMESLLLGMVVGAVILLLSILTGGKIGAGDGVLLMVTGIYLGLEQNLQLFFWGLMLCGLWALGLIVLQRSSRKDRIPFVPFLLAAYVGMLAIV